MLNDIKTLPIAIVKRAPNGANKELIGVKRFMHTFAVEPTPINSMVVALSLRIVVA
jgi:hypothetical protein